MHQKYPGEKIGLVMDNCSSHLIDFDQFENLEEIFLPPQTTAYLQPLDQGYFHQIKAHIIRWQREYIVLQDEKPSIKEKIDEFIDVACRIKPEVIAKYWRMGGLTSEEDPEATYSEDLGVLERIENVERVPMEKHEYAGLVLGENLPASVEVNGDVTIEIVEDTPCDHDDNGELEDFLPSTMAYSFDLTDSALDVLAEGFYCDEPNEDTQGSLSDEQLRQFVNNVV